MLVTPSYFPVLRTKGISLLNIFQEAKSSLVENLSLKYTFEAQAIFKIVKQIRSVLEEIICTVVDFQVLKTDYDYVHDYFLCYFEISYVFNYFCVI